MTSSPRHLTMTRSLAIAIVHLVATAIMVGVIWYVQLVHYPLMAGWPHDAFGEWEAAHRLRTGWIVMPVMLVEGLAAAWLLAMRPAGVPAWLVGIGAALLLLVWGSTFLVQVPCHETLARGWDDAVHARLVASNWLRTGVWSLRLAVAVAVLAAGCEAVRTGLRRDR